MRQPRPARDPLRASAVNAARIALVRAALAHHWLRDNGPGFVRRVHGSGLCAVNYNVNGWRGNHCTTLQQPIGGG